MSTECETSGSDPGGNGDVGTVAWIDLRPHRGPADTPTATDTYADGSGISTARFALECVGKAVRSDDRICPVSTTSIAVAFGSAASEVALDVLGDRLVLAIGPRPSADRSNISLTVAVGMAAPAPGEPCARVAQRARSAATSSARSLGVGQMHGLGVRSPLACTTVVTADRPVSARNSQVPVAAPGLLPHGAYTQIHRRDLHRYRTDEVNGIPVLSLFEVGVASASAASQVRSGGLCVLVIDPMAARDEPPGCSTLTAVSIADHAGCRTMTTVVAEDEPLVTAIDEVDVDVVVLVLDGAWAGRSPDWASGAWGRPSQLTAAYVDKGILVLAVSAGAGAGALAACVSRGALTLFSLDHLSDVLQSLKSSSIAEARQIEELGFPSRFQLLLKLTVGERRVLFYLTEGWGAQDIADELVISLTTVRSHIRSVLRKLEVKSQLAAVAVANGRDLQQYQMTINSSPGI